MPSQFPNSPVLLKGTLVVFEKPLPMPTNTITFQFNPESMTRNIKQQLGSGGRHEQPVARNTPVT
jgi:hypothetical protein